VYRKEHIHMGKEEELAPGLFQSVIDHLREHHKAAIEKAYEYFWEENYPEDFLKGSALDIAFFNFEDWLIFDYKVNEEKETFIEVYIKEQKELAGDRVAILNKIKATVLSLFEVVSIGQDDEITLSDLLQGGTFTISHKTLAGSLEKGDLFATRLLPLDGKTVMSSCVYPFSRGNRNKVIELIDKEFIRYRKNENPQGRMRDFLKNYGEIFNFLWVHCIRERYPEEHKT